jgi:Domain of unknown function (DUF4116)
MWNPFQSGLITMAKARPRLEKILALYGQALLEAVGQRELGDFNDLFSSCGEGTKCADFQRPEDRTAISLEIAEREAQLSPKDLIRRFSDMDPTDGKSRTQWLVKTYIADERFKLEDLGRAYEALAAFERFKPKLPREQRELYRLKSLQGLEELVAPFVKAEAKARLERDLSTATGRELRRLEELKARDESVVVQEGNGLPTIAVPMTKFASQWWGRGTTWCTAAEKNNAFAKYHKDAPLVIIVCPDGAKFQVHVTQHLEFMDATDKTVSKKMVQARWNDFESLLYWMTQHNREALDFIPEEHKTLELYHFVVHLNGQALYKVPERFKTAEICRIAVRQDGRALYDVPEEHKTPELCHWAVQSNWMAFTSVPDKYKTPDLCRLAVQSYGKALQYMSEDQKTYECCCIAVAQDGRALSDVPEKHRTLEIYNLALHQDGEALYDITPKHRTLQLFRLAVQNKGWALYGVPEEMKTRELCRLAVEQNGLALKYVPDEYKTLELCCLAVEQNGLALENVLEKYKTPELCRLAVEQNGWALRCVPGFVSRDYRTPELCLLAIQQDGKALAYVPENYKTLEFCRIAVEQNECALRHVPEELKTPELYACVSDAQPEWSRDILQGLYRSSQIRKLPNPLVG